MKTLFLLLASLALATTEPPPYETIENKATVPILTPSLAERKVGKIRLQNGLEAYLISDPKADQSAISVTVEAGSWLEPKEYPGMAHFCEHMLFLGTKTYPDEATFHHFITEHGGMTNAYTAPDRTAYMLSVNTPAFIEAIDRFSHFFIDPLFTASCISRELHAVDQEHAKNVENDAWRTHVVLQETGNPNHPNAVYSCGTAETLGNIPREKLISWYETHYSANQMHVVAISSLPLEELTQLVAKSFSSVPNHNLSQASYPQDLYSKEQYGHTLYIEPIKDKKNLMLIWQPAPEFVFDLDNNPLSLVAYVLGSGNEKSLSQQLKAQNLIESLRVQIEPESREIASFVIDIALTDSGLTKRDEVILTCFEALAKLKETGVPQYLFEEQKKVAQLNYQYQSREEAFTFVYQATQNILQEPLATFPQKQSIPTSYDPKVINAFLSTLTAESCLIVIEVDPSLTGISPTSKERWMDVPYSVEKTASTTLQEWAQARPSAQIELPSSNPYLPQNLALVSHETKNPEVIASDSSCEIYFAPDTEYKVPEVSISFALKTPLLDGSAKSIALFDLYQTALQEKLYPQLYYAKNAGLSLSLSIENFAFNLSLTGYSDKAPLFLETLFASLKKVAPTLEEFSTYKTSLLTDYDNASKELPFRQAMTALSSVLYNDRPESRAKYEALQKITLEEFLAFCENAFKKCYTEGFFFGNVTSVEASRSWYALKTILNAAPYPSAEQTRKTVLVLPEKQGPYRICKTTDRQGSGALLMLQEGPFSFQKRASQKILSTVLQSQFFDTLRTKQKTAYLVHAWDMEVERQLLQCFVVQSSTHEPQDLLSRFELFLEEFNHQLATEIPLEKFETIRQNRIQILEMPPENQALMAARLRSLAFEYGGDFAWIQKQIDAMKALSYETFQQDAHRFLSRENLKRLAILMEGPLPGAQPFRYETLTPDDLQLRGEYVSALSAQASSPTLYPQAQPED